MPLKCLIIDDEPLAHNVIKEYLVDIGKMDLIGQVYDPIKAIEFLEKNEVDLIFLDIKMPKISGLELIRLINPSSQIIITSAYEEYALEGYELNVCDYLLKPFRFERFLQAVEKARSNLGKSEIKPQKNKRKIFVKSDKKWIQIDIDNISCIESYGNYVKIWGDQCLLVNRTLQSFEEELDGYTFFKVHKSFFINKNKIKYVEGNRITLKNNKEVPISKNKKSEFFKFLQ